ncbi:hypothetical protein H4582DRAFT_2146753 [Lactarius indigo]|nr:hypothetical protein H4582DRAFT_2146753 [Lactarius indigo]
MIFELLRLVHGAAPGDGFTFLYSGHSKQQNSLDDVGKEDGKDEGTTIITSDLQHIADNELKSTLVDSLPIGCSLLAIFDTSFSGTMLNLPHSHCNNLYVPWLSKGARLRGYAMGFSHFPDLASLSSAGTVAGGGDRRLTHLPPLSGTPLRIDTRLGGSVDDGQTIQSAMSFGEPEAYLASPVLCDSPVPLFECDGWCQYDTFTHPKVLSLSPCSDSQRAWEGPNGSLTTVLCNYLRTQSRPSYRDLMSHVNFALHENALELHKYTHYQKKAAAFGQENGFDGELDDFQEPQLSSFGKLNMDDILDL